MARLFVVCCLFVMWSCAPRFTGVRLYELDLRLSIETETEEQRAGESAQLDFVVTNTGGLTLEACLDTEDLQVSFLRAGEYVGGASSFVAHPSCLERFVLGPAQEFRWATQTSVPVRAIGADELAASIMIVDPSSCGFGGCLSTRLEASGVPVRVVPADRMPAD